MPGIGKPFAKGVSGNPGGRPKIAKALEANGTSLTEVTAELVKRALEAIRTLDPTEASWRYAHQWIGYHVLGKPKESIEITSSDPGRIGNVGSLTDEQLAVLEALDNVGKDDGGSVH